MATCAACARPIVKPQRFVIDGTEVFHATCIGRAYMSKLRIAEQRVREYESQAFQVRAAATAAENELHRLRTQLAMQEAKAIVTDGQVHLLRAELELAHERLETVMGELQGARNRNIAQRDELARAAAQPPRPQAGEPAVMGKEEDPQEEESSTKRFKLLELD